MAKIKILPDILVSKIAAGEVIERPASVLKELIENSLDASAKKINIDLKSGGKRLIDVVDDGHGMSKDDALMSIERHATSKIKTVQDLFYLKTLGFRGEALPSIASVSRFKLITRATDDLSGTSISIEGGKIKKVEELGCPVGTNIEVENLFFNTQPRLKFLKRNETELIRVIEVIQREAISHPEVSFEVHHDGKLLFRFSSQRNLIDRISEIITNSELHELGVESNNVKVSGFMSSPYSTRSNTQKLYTYVNNRPVKDRFITRLVMDSYGKLLEKGKFPQGAFFIEVPSDDLDVNVHPTKHEIRFRNQGVVAEVIREALNNMLSSAPWIKGYKESVKSALTSFYEKKEDYRAKRPYSTQGYQKVFEPKKEFFITPEAVRDDFSSQSSSVSKSSESDEPEKLFGDVGFFSNMKIVGQVGVLYIICETENGIIVIDQHAAHERINYEKFRNAYLKNGYVQTQELLIPEVVELSPKEFNLLERFREEVIGFGFNAESFGDNTVRIKSVPALLETKSVKELFIDLLNELDELEEGKSLNEKLDLICATMACHKSIRASQVLNEEKICALLRDLDKAEFPHSCPHGRPTAKEITFDDFERMFRRT